MKVFKNRVMRVFIPKEGEEVTGGWKSCITRCIIICTLCQILG
jgi:hypothetical protein